MILLLTRLCLLCIHPCTELHDWLIIACPLLPSFMMESKSPPLVLILTERVLTVLLFSFVYKTYKMDIELVTAIQLPALSLWRKGEPGEEGLDFHTLSVWRMLALHRPTCLVSCSYMDYVTPKKNLCMVSYWLKRSTRWWYWSSSSSRRSSS